jgi:hypothetical protein
MFMRGIATGGTLRRRERAGLYASEFGFLTRADANQIGVGGATVQMLRL